jgi:predicted dehydrogenase
MEILETTELGEMPPVQPEDQKLGIGIIGCGRMGTRRAKIVKESEDQELVVVYDLDVNRSQELADSMNCRVVKTWQEVAQNEEIDIVIVSVPNKFMMPIVVSALDYGKHVLCEKPPGRNSSEADAMAEAARRNQGMLKIGFNKRYHPAVWKMHKLFEDGVLGELFYLRGIFGHGARPGYEKEWYADADLAGGGAMIDIGVHMVDLCRWYLDDVSEVFAMAPTYFWDLTAFPSGHQLDDNAFFLLKTDTGKVAQIHASWTQWKSRFSLEAFGSKGYLRLEGLGGNYGPAIITFSRRREEGGAPVEETYEITESDNSLAEEWREFIDAVKTNGEILADGDDGLETMRVVDGLYRSAHNGLVVSL